MEQEPIINEHNKQEYLSMHTEGMDSSLKKTFVVVRFFAWLLKYWWVPVCVTTLCYLFDLAGDFYCYANHSDYLNDWVPYTQLTIVIGCLSFLWRVTAFVMALAKKKWKISFFLFLFHLLS